MPLQPDSSELHLARLHRANALLASARASEAATEFAAVLDKTFAPPIGPDRTALEDMKNPACSRRPGRCDGILAVWLPLETKRAIPRVDQKRYSPLTETMFGSNFNPFFSAL
jgi:hypothetical protein